MRNNSRWFVVGLTLAAAALVAQGGAESVKKSLFSQDFESVVTDSLPEDFLPLRGQFSLRTEGGNRFVELPGSPLETFGVLFGPSSKENLSVEARILGVAKGRRSPTFSISCGGVNGYKLQVTPAKKTIEILKGEDLVASERFDWVTGAWTHLRLSVQRESAAAWRISGLAWSEGAKPPEKPLITFVDRDQPPNGRAGFWGSPFSGTPIRFDDLRVAAE